MVVSLVALLTAVVTVMYARKMLRLIPVLMGILAGYLSALVLGVVDLAPIREAAWFSVPWVAAMQSGAFAWPEFSLPAILFMLPVAIAPAIEHVGDVLAISSVTGKNYIRDPGLHRTLLGDGIATGLAALLGGPPNTTYSEVTGAVALTRAFNPVYMRIAAVTAILLAFVGKLGAVLKTIPVPVMGGILILLFGMIAVIGVNSLVKARIDMSRSRNLVIASVILVSGVGGMHITCGSFDIGDIGLAGLLGVFLNAVLPDRN
jgi:uracil permease